MFVFVFVNKNNMEEESAVDRWRRLFIHSCNMNERDHINIEQLMFGVEKRIVPIPMICKQQQEQGYFGSDVLYHQTLRVVEVAIFMFSIWKLRLVDRHTETNVLTQQVIDSSDSRLPDLERILNALISHCPALQIDKVLFGSFRWRLFCRVRSAQQDAPLSVSMLWTSLFSALWLCSNVEINYDRFIVDCAAIVGSNELVLFSLILSCLHLHYGLLPPRMYQLLLRINSANL